MIKSAIESEHNSEMTKRSAAAIIHNQHKQQTTNLEDTVNLQYKQYIETQPAESSNHKGRRNKLRTMSPFHPDGADGS